MNKEVQTQFLSVQVEEELWEEDFIERCFQEMLDEEEWDWFIPSRDLPSQGVGQLQDQVGLLVRDADRNVVVSRLSPGAASASATCNK